MKIKYYLQEAPNVRSSYDEYFDTELDMKVQVLFDPSYGGFERIIDIDEHDLLYIKNLYQLYDHIIREVITRQEKESESRDREEVLEIIRRNRVDDEI